MKDDQFKLVQIGTKVEVIGVAKTCGETAVVVDFKILTYWRHLFQGRVLIKYDSDGKERWISHRYLKLL